MGSVVRPFDAAVIELVDPLVSNPSTIPQGSGFSTFEYTCPTECTSQLPQPLTLIGSFLHMHEIGHQMYSSIYRNGQYLRELNRIDFWDFNLQQTTTIDITLQPGDSIQTHCIYAQRADRPSVFGTASDDEMCIQYLTYYPRVPNVQYCAYYHPSNFPANQNLTFCGTSPIQSPTLLQDDVALSLRDFPVVNAQCSTASSSSASSSASSAASSADSSAASSADSSAASSVDSSDASSSSDVDSPKATSGASALVAVNVALFIT